MRKVDVHDIIDNARFNRFHWLVVCLCALLLIFDGYDLFIYGVVLPVIMKEWGLTPLEAGALGSYALFGMMFGALAFGTLADRIGPELAAADESAARAHFVTTSRYEWMFFDAAYRQESWPV